MSDLVVVFRTSSDIEASIVSGLLDSRGIPSIRTSDPRMAVFPLAVGGGGAVGIAVHEDDAAEARRLIESHRDEVAGDKVVRLRDEFEGLQAAIGYRFRDRGLLEHALTHKSRAHEDLSGGVRDNESLEFLGDAVLGFVVADLLFREFPDFDEGQKSKVKAALVSTLSLARLAERLDLGAHLILGRGEEKTGGRHKQALLADAYEALLAAVYLDGGLEAARGFLHREFADAIREVRRPGYFGFDYKSALQEYLQARDQPPPVYRVLAESGPDHKKVFQIDVVVDAQTLASGTGRTKKDAEQEAAERALERLRADGEPPSR